MAPLEDANELVDRARGQEDKGATIFNRGFADMLAPIARADSSEADRPGGGSAQGLAVGLAPLEIFGGAERDVTVINCGSRRRSTEHADRVSPRRLGLLWMERTSCTACGRQWLGMLGNRVDWRRPEETLR